MKDLDFNPEINRGALSGRVSLPRAFAELLLWRRKPFDAAHALIDLYFLANNRAGQQTLGRGVVVTYEPGWILWSFRSLSERWGWDRETVSKFIHALVPSEFVRLHEIPPYGQAIILLDYDQYFTPDSTTEPATIPPLNPPLSGPCYDIEPAAGSTQNKKEKLEIGSTPPPPPRARADFCREPNSEEEVLEFACSIGADKFGAISWHRRKLNDPQHGYGRFLDWKLEFFECWRLKKGEFREQSNGAHDPRNNGAPSKPARTPAQARFEVSRALEAVRERNDSAHALGVESFSDDLDLEKDLEKKLAALEPNDS